MLSADLYEKCEEFFELIASEYITDEVETSIEDLKQFLLDDVDGRTNRDDHIVAEEVEIQMKDIWNLLPLEERKSNNNLCDYFDDIMETASEVIDGPVLVSSRDGDEDDYDYEEEESEEDDDMDDEEEYE
jgi:hypothetical protein